MSLRRAKSADEYVDWVKNAVFEVDDLRECMLFESEDDILRIPAWVDPLAESIKDLYNQMAEGRYHFGREDLPFMEIVHRYGDQIPFHTLLKQINETHRKGLEIDEEE